MPALIAFLGSAVAKIFTDKVLQWVAMKAILVFLFTVIVPIVLNNFMYDIIEIMMNFSNSQVAGATNLNGNISLSGVAAYFIEICKVSEALSVIVSALVLRVALRMIPFVRM